MASDTPLDEQPPCTDQLLRFVEEDGERERCAALLPTIEQREAFEKQCAAYVNAVRNIAFQNQVIADLIEQMEPPVEPAQRRARASFLAGWLPESITGAPKGQRPSELSPPGPLDPTALAALKLDVSERLAKRHFARTNRAALAAELRNTVNELRLQLWDASQSTQSAGTSQSDASREGSPSAAKSLRRRTVAASSQAEAQPDEPPRRVYTDTEVKAFLKRHAKSE
jgi:hypothetical protein